MRVLGFVLILYGFIAPVCAQATHQTSSLADLYARKLARMRTDDQVARLEQNFFLVKVARKACQIELEQKTLPQSCFEALIRESEWGLHSKHSQMQAENKLNERCAEASARLDLPSPLETRFLTKACRESAKQALRIRAYREIKGVRPQS